MRAPSGISVPEIPLGARILSVVDCFDALTSDRPYRPRLSNEEAFDILRERRGSMYDPLIVDTFLTAYTAIAPDAIKAGHLAKTLVSTQASDVADVPALSEIRWEAAELAMLNELRRVASKATSTQHVLDAISQATRIHTPATVLGAYLYLNETDVLRCTHAAGDPDGLLIGIEIRTGERTTGWCAANHKTILNSSAYLDLGARGDRFRPPLRATLATPIRAGSSVLGVLTMYSTLDQPFTNRDHYFAEQVASLLGEHLTNFNDRSGSIVRFPESSRVGGPRN